MRRGGRGSDYGWLGAVLLLTACTTQTTTHQGSPPDNYAQPASQDAPRLKEAEIHTDLIRQMLDQGQYYAALANIEEGQRNGGSEELTLLEGDARRNLGQTQQAEMLYRRLLSSRKYAAPAYHGLGLLYVKSDPDTAIADLRRAVDGSPTNVDFRSDLGYALMEAGRYTEAMPELSTAAELAPRQVKTRNNLIILYLLVGNDGAVQRLAQESAVTPERMRELRGVAQSIRDEQNARAAKAAG
jgi:tetratricopeptide (TPR) repeat protein